LRGIGFAALERSFGGQTAEIEALFARYFDVKLSGMAFCGAAFYGLPVAEGFQSLMLMYPVIMYIARWLAAGEGRQRMDIGDVERAMTIADHHHGYSPAMGSRNFRRRVRWLVQHGELAKLAGWYGA
jgi:lysine-N-methylase